MRQKPPTRHHFVPQLLLRHFTDADGRLWVFDKRAGLIQRRKTIDAFSENNLHKKIPLRGSPDIDLEFWLNSEIETPASPIIEKIINRVESGLLPNLSAPEKRTWARFFYTQFKRTPDALKKLIPVDAFDIKLDDAISKFEKQFRPLTESEKAGFRSPENRIQFRKNVWLDTLRMDGPEVERVLMNSGLLFAHINIPSKSFVIGSNPVIEFRPENGARIGSPGVEVWLPISSSVAITPTSLTSSEMIVKINDPSQVRKLNLAVLGQSTLIAGKSESLIRSLARPR